MSEDRERLISRGVPEAPPAYSPYAAGAAGPPAGAVPPGGYKTTQPVPAGAVPGGQYGTYGPPGYQPGGPQPSYIQQQPVTVIQQEATVVVVGGCPACRVGVLEDDFTCLGVCCAILFFPLGLICCLLMRQRRCPNCGAVFG